MRNPAEAPCCQDYFRSLIICACACWQGGSVSTSSDALQPGFVGHLWNSLHTTTSTSSGFLAASDSVAFSRPPDGLSTASDLLAYNFKGLPPATFPWSRDSRLEGDRELTRPRGLCQWSPATEGLKEHHAVAACFPLPAALVAETQRREACRLFVTPASYTFSKDAFLRHACACPAVRASWALVLVRALLRMLEFLGLQLIFLVLSLLLLWLLLLLLKAVEWFLGLSVIDFEFSFGDARRHPFASTTADRQARQDVTDEGQNNDFAFSFEAEEHETANIPPAGLPM
ncbi:putative transmembrane protein [Toxoplasma gondii GAB2-2007-GAL-DOM2]|uniref:Transmembrane protein n=7 Tax=Toxoplasma gondii TaxID=5811 RepID=S7V2N6_TOXGG|nr:hypothetical protein TGGT1_231125 [Toxoplasma gondii GT1]KAF4641734.1 hypothetical protein TGRH88_075450 [Toxoplasma gondii]KFG48430.1 putative transmembrane protein [Toxoplasma gondii GAB2-2007-GAL-DOM2]KFG50985.1 putative transmembrane protein [Toxoplasma gondii p89]KFG55440.1 putative transmembrane protein [Toxoplasma gondii FOU]PUA92774.1 putative transmembrane protein [Toxoplasma gondii TgCATBr9]RQX75915.1 putative transmembrane protein [Toxoplasma gondii CAST]